MVLLLAFEISRSGATQTHLAVLAFKAFSAFLCGFLFSSNSDGKGILMKQNPELALTCARRNVAGISFGPSPPHVFPVLFSSYAVRDGS